MTGPRSISDTKFITEWAIATAGSGLLIVVLPRLSPLVLGFCQWLVLRRYVSRSWTWLLATAVSTYLSAFVGGVLLIVLAFVGREDASWTTASMVFSLMLLVLFVRSGIQCIALAFIPQQRHCVWWLISGTLAAACGLAVVVAFLFAADATSTVSTIWRMSAIWQWALVYGLASAIAGAIEGRSLSKILSTKNK